MSSKSIVYVLGITLCILAIPALLMRFTNEVAWGPNDFLLAGVLIFSTGLLLCIVKKKVFNKKMQLVLILGIILFFLLLWAEMAVGVFGSPIAGN